MANQRLSRRTSLRLLAATPIFVSALGCGKKNEPDSCTDISALSEAEKLGRTALQYTDKSPQPDKRCEICNFWQASSDPAKCGGCQLVKGPIHPKGYCTAFAAKAS